MSNILEENFCIRQSCQVRVPAPCQYAHKLALLVGDALHKVPFFGALFWCTVWRCSWIQAKFKLKTLKNVMQICNLVTAVFLQVHKFPHILLFYLLSTYISRCQVQLVRWTTFYISCDHLSDLCKVVTILHTYLEDLDYWSSPLIFIWLRTLGNLYKNPPSRQVLTARWNSFREKRWWRNQLDLQHLQVIGWVAHLVTLFYSFETSCSSQPWGNLWPLYLRGGLTGGTFSLGKLVNIYLQKTLIAFAAPPRGCRARMSGRAALIRGTTRDGQYELKHARVNTKGSKVYIVVPACRPSDKDQECLDRFFQDQDQLNRLDVKVSFFLKDR